MAEHHETWGYVDESRCGACHGEGRIKYTHNQCFDGCHYGKLELAPCTACRSNRWYLNLRDWMKGCQQCNSRRKERADCKTCNGGELVEERVVPCRACSKGKKIRSEEGDLSGHNIWDSPSFSSKFLNWGLNMTLNVVSLDHNESRNDLNIVSQTNNKKNSYWTVSIYSLTLSVANYIVCFRQQLNALHVLLTRLELTKILLQPHTMVFLS